MHQSSILFDKQICYLHQLKLQWTDSKPMILHGWQHYSLVNFTFAYIYSHLVTGVCVIITKMSKLSISEIQGLHFTLLCLIKGNSTTFIYGTTEYINCKTIQLSTFYFKDIIIIKVLILSWILSWYTDLSWYRPNRYSLTLERYFMESGRHYKIGFDNPVTLPHQKKINNTCYN